MKKQTINFIGQVMVVGVVLAVIFYMMNVAMNRTEIVECYKWEAYSKQLKSFYLTKAEKAQCVEHGIVFDVTVK